MKEATVQVSCFSTSYIESRAIADAAVAALLPEADVNKPYLVTAMRERLLANPTVAALFPNAAGQITAMKRNQGVDLPAIVMLTISGDDPTAHLDPEVEPTGKILFWGASAGEPRDLGQQETTGFIHHCAVDMTMRYARAA